VNLGSSLAQSVYNYLDIGKSPRPADCIYVLSGNQERNAYGTKMWRYGYSRQLILCVGRSELPNFTQLRLETDSEPEPLLKRMSAAGDHFLIRRDRQQTSYAPARMGRLKIRSETRALAEYLSDIPVRSLLVVSSPIHMRRVALSFRRAFRKAGVHLAFVAVPENPSLSSPSIRAEIWMEFGKYILSRAFLL
jgi:hypothetical protein